MVIHDVNLPDMTGVEIIKLIKKIKEDQKIIVISGYYEEPINYPNVLIVQKPFETDQLLNSIHGVLDHTKTNP